MAENLWRLPDDPSVGWWITGLTDGEGCFYASYAIREKVAPGSGRIHRCFNYYVGLQIDLRADDAATLAKVRSHFGAGTIREKRVTKSRAKGAKPVVTFRIESIEVLVERVIPHFDRFQLQSKKANDYEAWKRLVLFIHQNLHGRKGWLRRFPDKVEQVVSMVEQVKDARAYRAANGGS